MAVLRLPRSAMLPCCATMLHLLYMLERFYDHLLSDVSIQDFMLPSA
jgi:hypothetical protein